MCLNDQKDGNVIELMFALAYTIMLISGLLLAGLIIIIMITAAVSIIFSTPFWLFILGIGMLLALTKLTE